MSLNCKCFLWGCFPLSLLDFNVLNKLHFSKNWWNRVCAIVFASLLRKGCASTYFVSTFLWWVCIYSMFDEPRRPSGLFLWSNEVVSVSVIALCSLVCLLLFYYVFQLLKKFCHLFNTSFDKVLKGVFLIRKCPLYFLK